MDVREQIRSRGLWYLLGIVFNRVVPAWLFRIRLFHIYELTKDSDRDLHDDGDQVQSDQIRTSRCNLQSDAVLAREVTRSGQTPLDIDGVDCWLCIDGDVPIGGVWIGRQRFVESELGLAIVLGDNQAWLFSAYVQKDRRGQGHYGRLLNDVMAQCRSEKILCAINPTNRASLAAHRRHIKVDHGKLLAMKFLGMSLCVGGRVIRPNRKVSFKSATSPIEIDVSQLPG